MKTVKAMAIAVFAIVFGQGAVQAQDLGQQPTEFPPASYKGKQYVDSQGCVFIRAGIDGDVTWVPRVTRDRKIVCGFQPSLSSQVASAAPVVEPAAPVIPEIAPESSVKPVVKPVIAKAPTARKAPRVIRQTAPKPVVIAAVPRPEDEFPAPVEGGNGAGTSADEITRQTRIVPLHVAVNRINTRNVQVPQGYRSVWDDDRLNPYRAEQNLDGRSDMLLVWTQSVPRRLIDRRNGRDVTATVPLVYPYLDVSVQARDLGEVTIVERNGQQLKRIIRNQQPLRVARAPVYSSRSAPAAAVAKPAAQAMPQPKGPAQYIQIGLFSTPEKARAAAQNVARLGLPARIGKQRQSGTTYSSVQAGPFQGDTATRNAQQRLERFGYAGAVLRK
jgi:SPOR domain